MVPGGRIQAIPGSVGGRLRWDDPLSERPLVLLVDAPGYCVKQVVASETEGETVAVPLLARGDAKVRVVRMGQPVSGIRLEWTFECAVQRVPEDGPRPVDDEEISLFEVTDRAGEAALPFGWDDDFSPPSQRFQVSAWQGAERIREWNFLNTAHLRAPPWVLELDPPTADLTVQLRDRRGEPIAGQELRLEIEPLEGPDRALYGSSWNHWVVQAREMGDVLTTDSSGEANAELLAPAVVHWALLDGPARSQSGQDAEPLLAGEKRILSLTADRRGPLSIQGRIVEADGAAPRLTWWETLSVTALRPEQARPDGRGIYTGQLIQPERADVSGDGSFQIDGLDAGGILLQVWGQGMLIEQAVKAGDSQVTLELPPRRPLYFRVRDARTGAGVEGGEVTLGQARYTAGMFTGPDGGCAFEAVVSSFDQVMVSAEGYATQQWSLAGLSDEELRRLVVELEPARSLEIQLRAEAEDWRRVRSFVRVDWPWRDASRQAMRFAGPRSTLSIPAAPYASFGLQALDDEEKPVGSVIVVPPGSQDARLELIWTP